MNRAAAIGFLFAAVLLGASGPYTARLSPLNYRTIKTVAVISALGNTFLFERVPEKADAQPGK